MENAEQTNQAPQRETTGGAKEESKEGEKLILKWNQNTFQNLARL